MAKKPDIKAILAFGKKDSDSEEVSEKKDKPRFGKKLLSAIKDEDEAALEMVLRNMVDDCMAEYDEEDDED